MLLLPGFAAAEARWGGWALALPVASYAAVWVFGLAAPSLEPGGGIAFNPFAWQLLFLTGAWLGRRALLEGRALPFDAPWARWISVAAAIVLLAGLALRLGWYGFAPWTNPMDEGPWITGKENLALPRLLHAWALAWLVAAWVPRDAAWMHRPVARLVAGIGRYSLEVFCLGLFLSWIAATLFRFLPPNSWECPGPGADRRRLRSPRIVRPMAGPAAPCRPGDRGRVTVTRTYIDNAPRPGLNIALA